MYDLAIVGAGPAGLSAAAYAIRKNLSFLVIADTLGGKALYRVNIPGAAEHRVLRADQLVDGFRRELEYLKDSYCIGEVTAISASEQGYALRVRTASQTKEVLAGNVIVATGTRIRKLGVAGETEFSGRGLGYSVLSYSHLLGGRRVFLYGDSQRTVDSALEAAAHAQSVVLLLEQMGRYHEVYREKLAGVKNVTLYENRAVVGFSGDNYCRSATLKDESGATEDVAADAFFLELRPAANSDIVADLVETDDHGHIVIDTRNRTSAAGIFAAGDVTTAGFEQSLVAIGEGAKALLSAYERITWSA